MILNKPSWKRLWLIALPVLGENALSLCVGWSDMILTARVLPEEKYLAAVTVCSYLYWLIDCFGYFASIGAQALISRYIGAGQPKRANEILLQSLLIAVLIGLLLLKLVWQSAEFVGVLIPLSTSTQQLVAEYLRIVALSYPLMMLMQVGCTAMQAAGHTFAVMCIMVVANLINIVFSWALAIGLGPLPKLTWAGIAIGTSVSLIAAGALTLCCLVKGIGDLRLPHKWPIPKLVQVRQILKISVPGACNWLVITWCYLLHLSIVSRLGDTAVATHGVAVWCESLSWLVGNSFSIAAATLVGQSLGANRTDLARSYGWLAFGMGGLFMSAMGVVFFICAPSLLVIFIGNGHKEVLTQGIPVLQLVAFAQPATAASTILTWALEGGAGDTRWPLAYSLAARLLVELPLAYALTGVWLNLGLYGAWLALVVSAYIQGIAAILRFAYGGWTKLSILPHTESL